MSTIEVRGLEAKRGTIGHGFVAVRFGAPLERGALEKARQVLVDAGVLASPTDEATLPERSSYLAGCWTPPAESGVSRARDALSVLERSYGAVKAVFLQVGTEVDAVAAARAEADDDDDDDDEIDEDERDELDDEVSNAETSHWKAGPPPRAESTPFPLDGYPDILEEFDWEDFGVAVKLGGEALPGELELVDAMHTFWLSPYIDSAAVPTDEGESDDDDDDDDGPPAPFRHARVTADPRHRSALLWVDRFAAPASVDEMVHHLVWVIAQLHDIVPVVHARFAQATMEMKYGELTGDEEPHLVLAGNPLATKLDRDGEAAALGWAESQSVFTPVEVAAMFVELGTRNDPDDAEEGPVALRMFERALALDPKNEDAMSYALLVLVKQGKVAEAIRRAERASDDGFLLFLIGTVVENAEASIREVTALIRPEVLADASGELVTPLVKAVGTHAPDALDATLAAVPQREDIVAYLHNAMYGVPDQRDQLKILLRTLELPLVDDGPHRAGYLSALNGACVLAHGIKDYDLAVQIADRAKEHADENPYIHHAAACAYAAVGRHREAFEHVKRAVATEYEHLDRVENDADLGPILEWPEHKALFAAWRARREASEPIVEATDDDFDAKVLEHDRPVLVDFTASWCGPCQRLAPIVEQLAAESGGRYRVVKLDVDESSATSARFDVRSMPTLVVFSGGEERARHVGFTDKRMLRSLLTEAGVKDTA